MKYFILSIVTITLFFGCAPQADQVDLEAEKSAVREVVVQMARAMQSEDVEMISNIVAHDPDMVNFGTDAAERWVGWDDFEASVRKQFQAFGASEVSASNQVIKVHPSGQVAWFSEIMDWSIETQGQQVDLKGLRLTGVLEKHNDEWVLVQMHFSVPVSGQAAEY
ncbi:MAG: hypothetical protein GWN62_05790 [Aliifodinibius sp.]|nr:hypothetical protein [Fodinibius sp.]